jgi:hypothetical protein
MTCTIFQHTSDTHCDAWQPNHLKLYCVWIVTLRNFQHFPDEASVHYWTLASPSVMVHSCREAGQSICGGWCLTLASPSMMGNYSLAVRPASPFEVGSAQCWPVHLWWGITYLQTGWPVHPWWGISDLQTGWPIHLRWEVWETGQSICGGAFLAYRPPGQSIWDGKYGKLASPSVMGHFWPTDRLASQFEMGSTGNWPVHLWWGISDLQTGWPVYLRWEVRQTGQSICDGAFLTCRQAGRSI